MSALAIAALAMLVVPANAETIVFTMDVNGGVAPTPGVEFMVEVWAQVNDNPYGAGTNSGGILGITGSLLDSTQDSTNALEPVELVTGTPPFETNTGTWNAYSTDPGIANALPWYGPPTAELNNSGYDVFGYTAQRNPAQWGTVGWESFLGGSTDSTTGVPTKIIEGLYTWDGTDATLSFVPDTAYIYDEDSAGANPGSASQSFDVTNAMITLSGDPGGDTPYAVSLVGDGLGAEEYTIDFRTPAGNLTTTLDGVVDTVGSPADGTPTWTITGNGATPDVVVAGEDLLVDRDLLVTAGYPYNPDPNGSGFMIPVSFTAAGATGGSNTASGTLYYIPEPGSVMMLLSGLIGMALCWWRRR